MKRVVVIAIVICLVSCHRAQVNPELAIGHSDTGKPALHAIRDQELRELMDRMDALMQERFLTETQLDQERRKYAQSMAEQASGLSKTVDAILAKMPSLGLVAEEQGTFMALANKLRQQTAQLHELALDNRIDAIEQSLSQLNTTCISCHALFRKTGS
jgi:cytochrome c556